MVQHLAFAVHNYHAFTQKSVIKIISKSTLLHDKNVIKIISKSTIVVTYNSEITDNMLVIYYIS